MERTLPRWLALALFAATSPLAFANSAGAPELTSGGPFPGERDCTACHQGQANSGPGMLQLLIGGESADGKMYTPGVASTIVVAFEDPNVSRIGFQLTVRSGDGCGDGGSLAAASSDDGDAIDVAEGHCGGGVEGHVVRATHRRPRNSSSTRFEVEWTPPAESVGPVSIAVAVNGANGNLAVSGDSIYTAVASLQPADQTDAGPMISDGGLMILGGESDTLPDGSPGAIVSLSGSGLATSSTSGSVDSDGDLATVVDGVCVEVSGVRAPIFHVAATEILFQVPVDAPLGAVAVEVIRNCDSPADGPQAVRSNMATLSISAVQPRFLDFSDAVAGVVALHEDLSVVAAADVWDSHVEGDHAHEPLPEPPARPAVPGEVVTLYGSGFGVASPGLRSGEAAEFGGSLEAASVRAMIGPFELASEDILYAGPSPAIAGLFQVSARIPDMVPEGDHSFSLILDGQAASVSPGLAIGVPQGDEALVCGLNVVIPVGGSCTGSISGIEGTFTVQAEGEQAGYGCIVAAALGLNQCYESEMSLLGVVGAERNDDGSWTITQFPEQP